MPRLPLVLIAVVAIAGAFLASRRFGPWTSRSSEPLASEDDVVAGIAEPTGSALVSEARDGPYESARQAVSQPSPDRVEGVVLPTSADGLWVEGLVRWPGGLPVAGARVKAYQEHQSRSLYPGLRSTVRTDEDGCFRITGIADAPCTLRAWARPGLEHAEWQGPSERRRSGLSTLRPHWRAMVEGVRPSRTDLVLVLSGGSTISGRVVDTWGAALPRFRVVITPADPGRPSRASTFRGEDGRFTLDGVQPGGWTAKASAVGYVASSETPVSAPQSGELTLVLAPFATATGVVLDPAGRPVSGAQIEVRPALEERSTFRRAGELTGEGGRFELSLPPGEHEILAKPGEDRHPGYVASATETLSVTTAETQEGLRLTLRPGATITGVLDSTAGDLAARAVSLHQLGGTREGRTRTDALGQFRFDGLPAGEYRLELLPEKEWQGTARRFKSTVRIGGRGGGTPRSSEICAASLTCELREGEERHVVLGAPQ